MAKKSKAAPALNSYQVMGERLQKIINSTTAQSERAATLSKLDTEKQEDWEMFIEEIETVDNVTLTIVNDTTVNIRWTVLQ